MLEVWLVVLILALFAIATIYFWIKIYIIDIVKSIEDTRKKKFTKSYWFLIWVQSIIFLLFLIFIAFKYNIMF
ncbi:Uncharacterised protein [Streptococcus pseudoporcinus]|nr:Uncharacterised protein [Streptococcus pseudoporcinus]